MDSPSDFIWVCRPIILQPPGFRFDIWLLGTWSRPSEPYDAKKVHEDIKYTPEDDKAIDDWIAGILFFVVLASSNWE